MEYIRTSELKLIARGSHSEIYQYLKPYKGVGMVVKVAPNPQYTISNLNMLSSTGCMKVFAELCDVEGKKAVLMVSVRNLRS